MNKMLRAAANFREEIFNKNPLYAQLQNGQEPEVAFIACSDSRVVPNTLTGTNPGELFVLRNAGNLVGSSAFAPNGEAASLEYAVQVLKVRHIVVCGHTRCGAVQYLLERKEGSRDLPAVSSWLTHAQELHVRIRALGEINPTRLLRVAVEENVKLQMEHLLSHAFIFDKVQSGKLQIHGWVYELETGSVYCRADNAFTLLTAP